MSIDAPCSTGLTRASRTHFQIGISNVSIEQVNLNILRAIVQMSPPFKTNLILALQANYY